MGISAEITMGYSFSCKPSRPPSIESYICVTPAHNYSLLAKT
jgi:hypothetical protein